MSEPRFTAGPWSIITPDLLEVADVLRLDLDPSAILIGNPHADTPRSAVVADVWMLDDEAEQQANADLIAAAPDLYTALKAILDCEQIDGVGGGRITLTFDYRSPLAERARAALQKAEGA